MKKSLALLFIALLFTSCGKGTTWIKSSEEGSEIIGNWINKGTYYAGSQIIGSTTFIFNSDKTFIAMDKAKGMTTLVESGSWLVHGDTLKMKYKKSKKNRPDIISYEERTGGTKDIIKPVVNDSTGSIAWNYKINGNKIIIDNPNYSYTGPHELERE